MTPEIVIDVFREAIIVTILMVGILILPALCVGLIISMFQAATQINEQTLSFLPRLFIVFIVLIVAGPWMLRLIIGLCEKIYQDIPILIG